MKASWKMLVRVAIFVLVSQGMFTTLAQENSEERPVLHIQRTVSTSQTGFPQFDHVYHVLNGVKSIAEARALVGTISLENRSPNFSEVLWLLAIKRVYYRAKPDLAVLV